jgi:Tetratricopeptide Repeats-Sensor
LQKKSELNISEILFCEEVKHMHAFIVRPFGIKNGIDFDRVDSELISPALDHFNISGGTTGEFIQQGNIRTDMFEQLLIADLVVADISIHNANAFYELGLRHAFRDKRTFLIKSEGDEVPFDLKTDRYMPYDADDPAASLPVMIKNIEATLESQNQDSPVFQLLPGLEPADPAKFIVIPLDFREEVQRAELSKNLTHLQTLFTNVDGFPWTTMGLRLVGKAQFKLKDWTGAKASWEAVRKYDKMDLEANTLLGTIYQRLDELVRSDQALERALQNSGMSSWDRAEIWALMARNAKTLWDADWKELWEIADVQKAALSSPHLEKSFVLYRKGYVEDCNHFYSGLNALAMSTIMTELAAAQPEIWEDDFDSEDEAALQLRKLKELRSDLAAGVKLSIESKRTALKRADQSDIWAEISAADLTMLTSTKPKRVGRAYMKALAGAQDFEQDSARKQLLLYQRLGILTENTQAALDDFPEEEHTK